MSVISNVLDYSKLEAGGVTIAHHAFQPAALVADVVIVLTPNAQQAGLQLLQQHRLPAEFSWTGDMARVRQVLVNLVGNAIKFTRSGSVCVETWVVEASAGTPGRLYFSVRDTGPGIPADKLAAIFEPFVQLEANRLVSQAGTGLGLPISRKLVQMMGGELTVTSEPGHGATFQFWLPAKTL
jgi:signal transduction histidine kinase